MRELPPGLPPAAPPAFAATGDRLAAALRRGRSRKRRKGALTGLAGVSVLVVLVSLSAGPAGVASLEPDPAGPVAPPRREGKPAPGGPGPHAGVAGGGPSRRAGAPAAPLPSPVSVAPPGAAAPRPGPVPTHTTPPPPPANGYFASDLSTSTVPHDGTCEIYDDADPAWCMRYRGDREATQGEPATLAYDVCRVVGDPAELRFPAFPVDFYLDPGYTVLQATGMPGASWQWSTGRRAPRPSAVTVPAGTCVRWTLRWNVTLRNGTYPEPGAHRLLPMLRDERDAAPVFYTVPFQISSR